MGLVLIQRVLAQLYTDTVLRERFFADPQREGEALGLSSDDMQHLIQLSVPQVNFFAASLKRKRLNEVCKLLPLTHHVLGNRFAALFLRYADTHLPKGIKKHRDDAIAFAAFIEQVARVDGIEPPCFMDLARYEASCLKAADSTCRWLVCLFRHPMDKVVRNLVQGDDAPLPSAQLTIALWFRLFRQRQVRHLILSLPRLL